MNFTIGKHKIGLNEPTYFIADIAANHDGSLKRAKKLIHLAAKAGATGAKFQNFKADKIVSRYGFEHLGGKLSHQSKWKNSVFEVYQEASINPNWTSELKQTCSEAGIDYFTSPYDFDSVDLVDSYVEVFKIGSGDISWLEILDYIASKGKPVLIATGAADLREVKKAMQVLLKRTKKIVLMQCNTNYTGAKENFKHINLNVLKTYQRLYPDIVLGLSDHTRGPATVLGAVALGARVIEKHFTEDNKREGPDHAFSMNPKSFREMVDRARELELALGDGIKRIEANETQSVIVQRRSLRAARNLKKGDTLKREDLVALRPIPQGGIAPYQIKDVIGKRIKQFIREGEHITWGKIYD